MVFQHPLAQAPLYTLLLFHVDAVLVEIVPVSAFESADHQLIGYFLNLLGRMVLVFILLATSFSPLRLLPTRHRLIRSSICRSFSALSCGTLRLHI